MTFEALFTLAVILVTVGLVAREFLRPDYLLLGGLLVLAAFGIVEPNEAPQGFANPALATIGGLGFFELAVVGIPIIVVGVAYLTLVSPALLPARESPEPPSEELRAYVTEVPLQAPSDLIGQTVEEAGLGEVEDLYLVRIDREARVISPVDPGEELVTGEWGLLLGVFFGTLVLTATVAASLSFSTPLNYQTNLMVYGPGKYRFSDFTRVGVPLQLALSVVAVAVIRWAWPLTAV